MYRKAKANPSKAKDATGAEPDISKSGTEVSKSGTDINEWQDCTVDVSFDGSDAMDKADRDIEELAAEMDSIKVSCNQTFTAICKKFKIPFELQDQYHEWLLNLGKINHRDVKRYQPTDLPRARGNYLKVGILIPPPYGVDWLERVEKKGEKWNFKYLAHEASVEEEMARPW